MQRIRDPSKYLRFLFHSEKLSYGCAFSPNFTTTIEVDLFSNEPFLRHRHKELNSFVNDYSLRHFMGIERNSTIDIENMTIEDIENTLQNLLSKNRSTQIVEIIKDCLDKRKLISDDTLKKLFRYYSISGKVGVVELLQNYASTLNPNLSKRNGGFLHYIAKAQCMRGNSEKGLVVLKQAYRKYEGLRSFYRIIFSELIYDSVQNRSEASIVIFKKYVLEFSETWNDHYPLICYWHICWSSTWFSDQVIAQELLESCKALQDIVKDKATIFAINILREYNDDAVIRLLQSLLKYGMMVEYAKVLQILFSYKLKNGDLRGCTEIIRNCETLGICLPSNQQGRYIKLLINNKQKPDDQDDKKKWQSPNFKLKF